MAERSSAPSALVRVVVAGGGIAGAETLLALRDMAGDRVTLTLVTPSDQLVLPALSVAESFVRGHAERHPLDALIEAVGAEYVRGNLATVEPHQREIRLDDGDSVAFDALVVAVGGRAVARVEHAMTWWPTGGADEYGALLRDLEEGYTKRVAFVIPPGAVWPLPLYELALMTARQVDSMGIEDAELTVITPEATPLAIFGPHAGVAIQEELERVQIRLETATTVRTETAPLRVVLQPTVRTLEVDRVVALPGVEGPRIPGTTQTDDGFIRVEHGGRMRGSDAVWAAGDAIAYPVKFGGLATQQADLVAADIAAHVGVDAPSELGTLHLRGTLMTGSAPRRLGQQPAGGSAQPPHPIWRPEEKVYGRYLTPYLTGRSAPTAPEEEPHGVAVEETLPGPEHGEDRTFHALWHPQQSSGEYLRRLGQRMRDYETRHQQSAEALRAHGQLRDSPSG